jgi:uncharacterized membrane protein
MSNCVSCGANLNPGAAFCGTCGASQNPAWSATAAAGNPAPAAAPMPVAAPAPAVAGAAGLSDNAAGALSYLAGLITGIIFLVLDPYKNSRFVRFHAFQSIFFNIAWIVFWIVWSIFGVILIAITKGLFAFILMPIELLIALGGLVLWIYLMYSASQGKTFRIPVIGNIAAKQAGL